ncbi:hypothetical protein ACLQ50_001755, partial [Campylobacter jejuni]
IPKIKNIQEAVCNMKAIQKTDIIELDEVFPFFAFKIPLDRVNKNGAVEKARAAKPKTKAVVIS